MRKALVREMRGRIKEDDAEVPLLDPPYLYYVRHNEGGQHPIFCRAAEDGGAEETLLDGDAEGAGKSLLRHRRSAPFARPRKARLERRRQWLGAACDSRPRSPRSATDSADVVTDTDGSLVWSADSRLFYYVRVDENHRPAAILRHEVGADPASDAIVFEERDPRWFLHIRRSQSGAFAIVSVSDHDSSECRLIDLSDPEREAAPDRAARARPAL